MNRIRRVALQPLCFSTLSACGTVLAFMAASAGTAAAQPDIEDDEFLCIATTYGGQTQIAEFRATFFEQVQGPPMPHWVPIDALHQKPLSHKGSVEVYPQYYQHTFSAVFGPAAGPPAFAGFQSGTLYRVEIERRDPGFTNWVDDSELEWGHP